MKFFNLDCHVSVIADLTKIFTELGHEVTSWSLSGHSNIFGREASKVEVVNQNTWMGLDDKMCEDFYEKYKDDLSQYDGFICTYPLSFSMLYAKFKKPIILHVPIRYEVPFSANPNMWNKFNSYLREGIDSGMIVPVANSEYDKRYFEFFVQRNCQMIPNICEYTNTKWNPTKNQFLYSGRLKFNFPPNIIVDKDSLGRYEWSDLSQFLGIIVIPYTCSTMSIFEHYNANIPLFFPSKRFILELYESYGNAVLSEITWNRIFNLPPGSSIDCDRENDPNSFDNMRIVGRWIEYSDFYNQESMPHIIYFDSIEDLSIKISNTNLKEVSEKMSEFNSSKSKKIYAEWDNIIKNLNK
jgi:hypothetical protein